MSRHNISQDASAVPEPSLPAGAGSAHTLSAPTQPNGSNGKPKVTTLSLPETFVSQCKQLGVYPASSDYPLAQALLSRGVLVWDEDDLPLRNMLKLAIFLSRSGDLYRNPAHASGLVLAPDAPNIDPRPITTPKEFNAVIVDRLPVRVLKNGNTRSQEIPSRHLETMLRSEIFLQAFRPLDQVVRVPLYLPGFRPTRPGYNDGGPGHRVLYRGPEPRIEPTPVAIPKFLDVMAFASNADRTNAVGAALLVMLRNHWPGAKPLISVTSTKSHGGKDTVIAFAAGSTPKVSVDYQSTDWAFRKEFLATLKACPDAGVINIENARLGKGDRQIASATLERFLTDPEPVLSAATGGDSVKIKNNLVVASSTNFGTKSEDLMNRSLPIHLCPVGNVADREPSIGNPKLEFLPKNRDQIEAELRGMIAKWKDASSPLDSTVKHPFGPCMQTIGGILKANGFQDFLGNYSLRRTSDDPVRKGLGQLGIARMDVWLLPDDWARIAVREGLVKAILPEGNRDSDRARERGIGQMLSAHRDETFRVETDDVNMTLKLEKKRALFDEDELSTRYRFRVINTEPVAGDVEPVEPV